jgi:hypothetical protein
MTYPQQIGSSKPTSHGSDWSISAHQTSPRTPGWRIPYRRYVLIHGSLSDLGSWDETFGKSAQPPAFAWPADRSWCFASDVDPHWAGIGAEQAAIDSLLNAHELDVVTAQPTEPQPTYY